MVRALAFAFVTLSCAGILLGLAAAVGCVTSPPPDLVQPPVTRPAILHEAVQPPPADTLTELPSQFVVPVQVSSASPTFYWEVFVDYDFCQATTGCSPTAPDTYPTIVPPAPGTEDGGVAVVGFQLVQKPDPSVAHRIDFLVAHSFSVQSPHTWDSVGGDIATWTYDPGGSASGFPLYDAGALQDGAFPPADAPSDGVLITPESGAGDP